MVLEESNLFAEGRFFGVTLVIVEAVTQQSAHSLLVPPDLFLPLQAPLLPHSLLTRPLRPPLLFLVPLLLQSFVLLIFLKHLHL